MTAATHPHRRKLRRCGLRVNLLLTPGAPWSPPDGSGSPPRTTRGDESSGKPQQKLRPSGGGLLSSCLPGCGLPASLSTLSRDGNTQGPPHGTKAFTGPSASSSSRLSPPRGANLRGATVMPFCSATLHVTPHRASRHLALRFFAQQSKASLEDFTIITFGLPMAALHSLPHHHRSLSKPSVAASIVSDAASLAQPALGDDEGGLPSKVHDSRTSRLTADGGRLEGFPQGVAGAAISVAMAEGETVAMVEVFPTGGAATQVHHQAGLLDTIKGAPAGNMSPLEKNFSFASSFKSSPALNSMLHPLLLPTNDGEELLGGLPSVVVSAGGSLGGPAAAVAAGIAVDAGALIGSNRVVLV